MPSLPPTAIEMAHNRDELVAQSHRRQPPKHIQGKHPQGVSKVRRPPRRRPGLNSEPDENPKHQRSPTIKETLQQTDLSTSPQLRAQKRSREAEDLSIESTTAPLPKRQRPRTRASAEFAATKPVDRETSSNINAIDCWRKNYTWPKEYFEPDNTMNRLLARKKSTPSLRRKRSESGSLVASSTTPSDQKPREEKSAPYRDARYRTLLETKGSYLRNYIGTKEKGITEVSKRICQSLLETAQHVPKDSLFDDDIFNYTCDMISDRNEAKVIQDIGQLVVPSAQALAARSAELQCLIESVNEGWNNSIPFIGTRPQPDYSVGFKREAFSDDQLHKLSPFIGEFLSGDQSFFMSTYYMYFPFLTCEVKCGAAALDIADRQNAHSMTLAVRAVAELFRCVKREDEINREILAFSVSHNDHIVQIFGHYAVIDGPKTTFYRHPIHTFDFTALDGRDKWTAYRFTTNVYNTWMPTHFKKICSAIDDLPSELDFDVTPLPQDFDVPPPPQDSGLSQDLESHHLSRSFVESASQIGDDDSQSEMADITPNTSLTQHGASKRLRRKETE